MNGVLICKALGVAATLALLTACGGSGYSGGAPGAAPSQGATTQMRGNAPVAKLSGEYSGTEKESGISRPVTLSLAQYGNALGGNVTIKTPKGRVIDRITFSVSGTTLNGTIVSLNGTSYCTFSQKAKYDTKALKLSGSFKAVYRCSGETGTYTVKHNCVYKGNPAEDIRPESGPRPC